ncbi:MAG: hypothetical protein J7K61_02025 [Thermoplasmata archaeon]|nr:hypothetical protein [Thermoplasmata archaeon]
MNKEEAMNRIMQLLHEINEVISREKRKKGEKMLPYLQQNRIFKPIPKILNFIEERAKKESCPYFTAKQLLNEYKSTFPDEEIHISWIALAISILHKEGKIQKWNSKTWKWIANGGKNE